MLLLFLNFQIAQLHKHRNSYLPFSIIQVLNHKDSHIQQRAMQLWKYSLKNWKLLASVKHSEISFKKMTEWGRNGQITLQKRHLNACQGMYFKTVWKQSSEDERITAKCNWLTAAVLNFTALIFHLTLPNLVGFPKSFVIQRSFPEL